MRIPYDNLMIPINTGTIRSIGNSNDRILMNSIILGIDYQTQHTGSSYLHYTDYNLP